MPENKENGRRGSRTESYSPGKPPRRDSKQGNITAGKQTNTDDSDEIKVLICLVCGEQVARSKEGAVELVKAVQVSRLESILAVMCKLYQNRDCRTPRYRRIRQNCSISYYRHKHHHLHSAHHLDHQLHQLRQAISRRFLIHFFFLHHSHPITRTLTNWLVQPQHALRTSVLGPKRKSESSLDRKEHKPKRRNQRSEGKSSFSGKCLKLGRNQ